MSEDENVWTEDYELQALGLVGSAIADRYEIERVLGQGGMASVYLATDQLLDRQVAIKLMKSGVVSRQNPGRFYREARTLAKMNHPNIVTLYNCGWYGEQAYLVMEYVDGTCLNNILDRTASATPSDGGLTVETSFDIAIKVTNALSYAHQKGVVHRDIKPANIIIGNETKLMDFGIAGIRRDASSAIGGELSGTPMYMSPEQSLGKEVDERADLYSLGVVFYEMFTGRAPFSASDEMSITAQHIQVTPVAPSLRNPEIPQKIDSLILRMLSKEPDKRPASADEVVALLETSRREIPEGASAEIPKLARLSPEEQKTVDALRGIPLFAPISREDLAELSHKLTKKHYRKGQVVIRKGDPGSSLHLIITGRVKISMPEDGTEVVLAHLGPDDFFGELALLDEQPRSAKATAVETTETWVLERGDFLDFLKWYPDTTILILTVLGQRLRNLNSHLESTIFTSPPVRLAKTLMELMDSHGQKTPTGQEIIRNLTAAELAGIAGIETTAARKLIRDLETAGILSAKNRRYTIHKPEELHRIATGRQRN